MGFPYLGGLTSKLTIPRLSTPRTSVPRGSIAIAGEMTGVYPADSPGGWRIIGRTNLQIFDMKNHPPALFSVGDQVKFVSITEDDYRVSCTVQDARDAAMVSNTTNVAKTVNGYPLFKTKLPGLFTTIQDLGRPNYQKYGVTVSGVMDRYSSRVANLLVGNEEDKACLEVTILGPSLEVENKILFAVTGGNLSPLLNDESIPMWQTCIAYPGDLLSFGGWKSGARGYIAVAGGFNVPKVLGSHSTHVSSRMGGLDGRNLRSGDILMGERNSRPIELYDGLQVPTKLIPKYKRGTTIQVLMGPQNEYYTSEGIGTFLSSQYTISSKSNRMGYRLEGKKIENVEGTDIISEAIPLGAIQVPSDGQPIIMMADRQTTGGYSKIACVIGIDVDELAQLRPLDFISFKSTTLEEAHRLIHEREATFNYLSDLLQSERLLRALMG